MWGQNQKMIDLKTYLNYSKSPDLFAEHIDEIREYNKALIQKYPWVEIINTGNYDPYPEQELTEDMRYNWTWLDAIEPGWRLAFSEQLCEELQKELERTNFVNAYVITDIKEKFGVLHWYSASEPAVSNVHEILEKYEELSKKYCMECGKPNEWILDDPYWIYYYCNDCKERLEKEEGLKFRRMN